MYFSFLNSRFLYCIFLAVALGLTYVDGQVQNSALIYYFSFLFYLLCFFFNKSYLRPAYCYLLILNPYVLVGTVGLWEAFKEKFWAFGDFPSEVFVMSFRIGLVALLGVAVPLAWRKLEEYKRPAYTMNSSNYVFGYILLLLILFGIIGESIYVYINRRLFLEEYFWHIALYDREIARKFMPIVYFDFFVFGISFLFLTYFQNWHKSIFFWINVTVFIILHVLIGSRYGMVFYSLLIFWRYYTQFGIKMLDSPFVRIFIFIISWLMLGAFGILREGASDFSEIFLFSAYYMILEFSNVVITTLTSVLLVINNLKPPMLMSLLDPFIGLIPTFLVPGKRELLTFDAWIDSIAGGFEAVTPVGGYFLPANIYLITGSLFAVFLFFFCLSLFFERMYKNLFSTNKIQLMKGLVAASLILILSVRIEYWIQLKLLIQWVYILPVLLFIISEIMLLHNGKIKSSFMKRSSQMIIEPRS